LLEQGEPGFAYDTNELKIGDGVRHWNDLPLLTGEPIPPIAESSNLTVVESLPVEGENDLIYKIDSTQKLYIWNNENKSYQEIGEKQENVDNIIIVDSLPEFGLDNIIYKVNSTQQFYFWNNLTNSFNDFISTNTEIIQNGIKVVDELIAPGDENVLYKVSSTQELYMWNSLNSSYETLIQPTGEVVVEKAIIVVETFNSLPLIGANDLIYKVNDTQTLYIWNNLENIYEEVAAEGKPEDVPVGGIIVVENFESLPEIGANDSLYKINSTQKIYIWNSLLNVYQELGQGGGGDTPQEGYVITLQNASDSRIFAALEGDTVNIAFRYASVDADGLNDGPGIGTLIVNQVKKANIAIQQKLNTLDITKYLALGANSVELIVENSENKTKTLTYQIEIISLSLSTKFKEMDIYTSDTDFAFVITGAGTKTVHYVMDGKEIDSEVLTNTTKLAHTYKIPMQTAGDHIFEVYADMEVNNMEVTSNTITLGMMYVTDTMVDTFILSNFTQKTSTQGEIITIPYLVYNPFNETSEVTLTILQENREVYFEKTLYVD
jgi:hypothetical protein